MRTSLATIAIGACALLLSACDKTPTNPPTPTLGPAQSASGTTAPPVADTSVPSAASVLAPAGATKVDPAPARSNGTMSALQESTAMPLPRQNNDHSAPLGPARPASAP